jgi:hypothetical protein
MTTNRSAKGTIGSLPRTWGVGSKARNCDISSIGRTGKDYGIAAITQDNRCYQKNFKGYPEQKIKLLT